MCPGEEAVEYCINHSEATMIFVSTANWSKLQAALPRLQNVQTLVFIGADAGKTVRQIYTGDFTRPFESV